MSAELVCKSLSIVDPDLNLTSSKQKRIKNATDLMPSNHKLVKNVNRKGYKEKIGLLSKSSKLTVVDVRKNHKTKEQILHENQKKLELIKKVCNIDLDKNITSQIIERAVTKRPVKTKSLVKETVKTAFTEEDFKKFEEEYFDE